MSFWGYNDDGNQEPLTNDRYRTRRPPPSVPKRFLIAILYLAAVAALLAIVTWLT